MSKAGTHNRHFGRKYSRFGEDGYGQEVTAYGNSTGKYFKWDYENDKEVVKGDREQAGNITLTGSMSASGGFSGSGVNPTLTGYAATGALAAGKPVYISGYYTSLAGPKFALALAGQSSVGNPAQFIVSSPATAAAGAVTVVGEYTLSGVATSEWTAAGDPVYLSSTAAGVIVKDRPTLMGTFVQALGYVTVKSTVGTMKLMPFYNKPRTIAASTA